MTAIGIIAALTMREALRRRLVAALGVICLALVALGGWGFYRLSHNSAMTSGEVDGALPQAFVLFMFMFSFVVALSASAIASPSVSAEIESGVLQTVVTRPVRRRDVILGKWLGLAAILAAYTAAVVGLQVAVIDAVSGFVPPDPVGAAAYLFAEGAVLLTVVLLLSTRLSALAAGVAGVALFGIAWLAGVVGALGASFSIQALQTASKICQYVVPTDGLWHGAIFALEPRSYVALALTQRDEQGNPFFATAGPTWSYLTWAAVWFVVVLGLSVASFERREL